MPDPLGVEAIAERIEAYTAEDSTLGISQAAVWYARDTPALLAALKEANEDKQRWETTGHDRAAALLNAAERIKALEARAERYREALELLAKGGCDDRSGRLEGTEDCLTYYPTQPVQWCVACVALAALSEEAENG